MPSPEERSKRDQTTWPVCVDPSPEASSPARLEARKQWPTGDGLRTGDAITPLSDRPLGSLYFGSSNDVQNQTPRQRSIACLRSLMKDVMKHPADPFRYPCYDSTDSRY